MPLEPLELPKPCGARPRSVELPWAAQVRVPLVTRWLETRFGLLFWVRMLLPAADCGRFLDKSFCLVKVPPLFGERFEPVFGEKFPARPGVSLLVLIVRTRMSDAPLAGAVRAMTDRFWTDIGGLATFPLADAAPNELCLPGVRRRSFVTRAPRNEALVRRAAPRLIARPPVKSPRDAAVTARALRA